MLAALAFLGVGTFSDLRGASGREFLLEHLDGPLQSVGAWSVRARVGGVLRAATTEARGRQSRAAGQITDSLRERRGAL